MRPWAGTKTIITLLFESAPAQPAWVGEGRRNRECGGKKENTVSYLHLWTCTSLHVGDGMTTSRFAALALNHPRNPTEEIVHQQDEVQSSNGNS